MPSSASLDGLEEVAREEATEVLAGAELAGPPPSEEVGPSYDNLSAAGHSWEPQLRSLLCLH